MAENQSFPQIPTTVWWGLRQALRKSPNATIDEGFLAVNLNVQMAAAKQYVTELTRVGLLTEDKRSTPLAMKWRNDETYRDAADEIIKTVYPQALQDVAPPQEAERSKVVAWFMHQGLGEGTAKNKAATYLLIANEQIQDGTEARATSSRTAPSERKVARPKKDNDAPTTAPTRTEGKRTSRVDAMPLNINVQIHISADASGEQIEKIFSSMRRYLYDDAA